MTRFPLKQLTLRLVPYLAVVTGLYGFHSAWGALLAYHAGMLLAFGLTRQWPKLDRFRPAGLRTWGALLSIPCLLAGVLIYATWPSLVNVQSATARLTAIGLTPAIWPWFIAYFAIVNPWLEETYWRGLLADPSRALPLDEIWFGAYHLLILFPFVGWTSLLLAQAALSLAAWTWRRVARHTSSLLAPSVSHLVADLSILLAVYLRSLP